MQGLSGYYVIGAGGHAKVVVDTLNALDLSILGIIDDNSKKANTNFEGIRIVGDTAWLREHAQHQTLQAILAIGDNRVRQRVAASLPKVDFAAFVHPRAYVSATASIAAGTMVMAGAIVQPRATIGRHVIINTAASVDHDCVLEDYVHVAPGTRLAGAVTLEQGVFMGIGSCVIPAKRVGAWATVGAGATVIDDVPPHVTVVGTPARVR